MQESGTYAYHLKPFSIDKDRTSYPMRLPGLMNLILIVSRLFNIQGRGPLSCDFVNNNRNNNSNNNERKREREKKKKKKKRKEKKRKKETKVDMHTDIYRPISFSLGM